ncbi:hypothetical protein ALC62_13310, partial [Cyphomyrmex costatus]
YLAQAGIPTFPQPPYSPDVTPPNFFLFPLLKRPMKGQHFETAENGIVEIEVNRFIKSSLTKLIARPAKWKEKLQNVQFIINNSIHSALRTTLSKMLFGCEQRGRANDILKSLMNDLEESQGDFDKQRESVRDMAISANVKLREYNRMYYNERHKKPTQYKQGDYVLVR